jgi:two-component system CheB/CheR fusion protein
MKKSVSGKIVDTQADAMNPRFVVGIGASAGGLESLEKLFRSLPPDTGMAFVVLQHLSPDFKSMMLELLGRDTTMTIRRAEDDMQVESNSVYLLPPKKEMVIRDGRLFLTEKDRHKGLVLPIDTFLESLAQECGERAIAIILSGSGSDGARGVVEIARHGGYVICETTETAKFDGMPSSAIAVGVVDEVLPPEEIGPLLQKLSYEPTVTRTQRIALHDSQVASLQGLEAIFDLFRRQYDIDFSVYKDTTVLRRIQRRVTMVGASSIDDYARCLQADPDELNSLYADLLIGVTQFFRDPETFGLLQNNIFPQLISQRAAGQPLRAWIAGCATGEEPYSLAIAFHEAFEALTLPYQLKLFATDVHKASLEFAGRGIYCNEVLKGMSPERIEKYFIPRDGGYQVKPNIRKSIVFAPHNVLNDAPFTDLDFVSCRNLLIYFQPVAQTRALSMFHYGLRKGGVLLLGGSESPGDLSGEFDVVHDRARIYLKRNETKLPSEFRTPLNRSSPAELHAASVRVSPALRKSQTEQSVLHDQLLNRFMPPSLLIDENRSLIDSFGGAEKFLRLRARHPSLDVLDLMDDSLRTTLSGAIGRTLKEIAPVRFANVALTVNGVEQVYNLTVTPVSHPSIHGRHHVISFEALGSRVADAAIETQQIPGELDASRDHIRQLEDDLRYSRENLQSTIEELETSNEELQATNEELIASNEELQSTNEELHSVNEELYTVNAEHQRKIQELAELNQDMNHLLENTDVATVFLDRELRVRRFTSQVQRVFDLVEQDVGRSISSFQPRFVTPDLLERLRQVMKTGERQDYETVADDSTRYLMRMLPYRINEAIEGVVLMFVDVSSLEMLRDRLRWMSAIVEFTADAIVGQDLKGNITTWNAGAERLYGYTAEDAIGQSVRMLMPESRRQEVEEYHNSIKAGDLRHTRDSIRVHKDGTELHVSLTVSPVFDGHQQLIGISKIARDISPRIRMEQEIRDQIRQREAFLATLSHELRNPLGAALNASRLLQDERADDATRKSAAAIVQRQIKMTRTLLVDLLDMSRISQGKIELRMQTLDLRALVDDVQETTMSEAVCHQQDVVWDLPTEPLLVHGDSTRLVQVQVNLIHNALKYSPAATDVRVTLSRDGEWATIKVEDEGMGIPNEELQRIFEPFVQVSRTQDKSEGGLGVGLTLVRTLIEAHGGTVEARSHGLNQGSIFTVRLPAVNNVVSAESSACDNANGYTTEGLVSSPRPVTSRPLRIVLVEDIDDSRKMLDALLSLDGHLVSSYGDGETGLEAVLQQRPDVALLDIGLPGMDGYEVARRIRQVKELQSMMLIALTGFGQDSDLARATASGFDAHLVKPIDPTELESLLDQVSSTTMPTC